MDTAWMQSPEGEVKEVPVNELTPYMVSGWNQCQAPATQPDEQPDADEEDLNDAESE